LVDAQQDMIDTLKFVKGTFAHRELILWGSSYSAALALKTAGDKPDLVDGVLSFAPGEYFERIGKSGDWIQSSASKIQVPSFITSAKNEHGKWKAIFNTIPGETEQSFVLTTTGNHGSRALWEQFDDHSAYWKEVESFLGQFGMWLNRTGV